MPQGLVAHYRIFEEIGRGAMGVVYRAEDTRLGRPVALKFLPEKLAEDHLALERLHREARASSALNHPNICTIHDIAVHDGQTFLVMELLHGETLRARIAGKALALTDIVEYGIQISDALEAAHRKGIIHRDIKPTNLFVSEQSLVKILDFGIAKLDSQRLARRSLQGTGQGTGQGTTLTMEETLTKSGATVGTLAYMSPEQARGERIDGRSDIFAFGVVLYEMATGKPPFSGETTAVLFDAILNRPPHPPHHLNPHIPAELERIILKAVEKDRELRYQGVGELRADLRRLKRDLETGRIRIRAGGGRLRLAAVGASLALAGVLVVGFPLGWYRHSAEGGRITVTPRALTTNRPSLPVLGAAISPDGKYLSYIDSTGVYVKLLGSEETHRLVLPKGIRGRTLCWFPDGARILLVAWGAEGTAPSLWALSVLGGEPLQVRADASTAAVSPDGNQIAFLPGLGGREIWVSDARGREPRRIATAPAGSRYGSLAWTADRKWIVALSWKAGAAGPTGALESHRLDGGKVSVLTESPYIVPTVDSGVWCTSRGDILFCMGELPPHTMDTNLWRIRMDPRTGGPAGRAQRLTDWAAVTVEAPCLTTDGSDLTVLRSTTRADVMVGSLAEEGEAIGGVRSITQKPGDNIPTGWSRAGDRLLFMSNRQGTYDVFEADLRSGAIEAKVSGPDHEGGAFYSGGTTEELLYWRWALNDGREAFNAQLMRLPRDGSKAKAVLTARRRMVSISSLPSPDSGCMAVIMEPDTKRLSIDALDVIHETLTERARIDLDPAEWRQWSGSPDGRRLVLLGAGGRVRVLRADGSFERDILVKEWGDALRSVTWTADGRGFLAIWSTPGSSALLRIGMDGRVISLYQTEGAPLGDIVCSPDGRRVAFTRSEVERNAFLLEGVRLQPRAALTAGP